MILTAYIDESVKREKFFTLSAVIGIGKDWVKLSAEWKIMLQAVNGDLIAEGRPPISRCHASEFNAYSQEFDGWSKEEALAFSQKMLGIVGRYPMKTISYTVDLEALRSAVTQELDLIGTAYCLCGHMLIYRIGKWLREKDASASVRITLFHDRGDYDAVLLQTFNDLLESPFFETREYFVTLAPMKSEECLPLQVADMLAYENMRDAERRYNGGPVRKPLDLIINTKEMGALTHIINKTTVAAIASFLPLVTVTPKKKRRGDSKRSADQKRLRDAIDRAVES